VCVVANPNAICGDGSKFATEECDDGAANANAPDACRTNCKFPACGDGILDSGEECEPGVDPGCLDVCFLEEPDEGCCNVGGSNPGALLLAAGVGLMLARRRKRPPGR
jgi:hypothetical protein